MRHAGKSLLLVLILACMCQAKAQRSSVERLSQVHSIYVGEMGKSDDSERFRLLLADYLLKQGFVIVDKAEDADAKLTGVLATQLESGTTQARVTAQLKSGGRMLWGRDIGVRRDKFRIGFKYRDNVKLRAEDLAKALRKDWDKDAKVK